jgi:hypothetical protein
MNRLSSVTSRTLVLVHAMFDTAQTADAFAFILIAWFPHKRRRPTRALI